MARGEARLDGRDLPSFPNSMAPRRRRGRGGGRFRQAAAARLRRQPRPRDRPTFGTRALAYVVPWSRGKNWAVGPWFGRLQRSFVHQSSPVFCLPRFLSLLGRSVRGQPNVARGRGRGHRRRRGRDRIQQVPEARCRGRRGEQGAPHRGGGRGDGAVRERAQRGRGHQGRAGGRRGGEAGVEDVEGVVRSRDGARGLRVRRRFPGRGRLDVGQRENCRKAGGGEGGGGRRRRGVHAGAAAREGRGERVPRAQLRRLRHHLAIRGLLLRKVPRPHPPRVHASDRILSTAPCRVRPHSPPRRTQPRLPLPHSCAVKVDEAPARPSAAKEEGEAGEAEGAEGSEAGSEVLDEKSYLENSAAGSVFATLLSRLERRAEGWPLLAGMDGVDPMLSSSAQIGFALPIIKLGWGVSVSLSVTQSSLLRCGRAPHTTAATTTSSSSSSSSPAADLIPPSRLPALTRALVPACAAGPTSRARRRRRHSRWLLRRRRRSTSCQPAPRPSRRDPPRGGVSLVEGAGFAAAGSACGGYVSAAAGGPAKRGECAPRAPGAGRTWAQGPGGRGERDYDS